jgi:hypothetical protein
MGGACDTYGGKDELHRGFWLGDVTERDHLEDLGVGGRIILKWIFKKWDGDIDWFDVAQERNRWRALVNAVNFLTP